MNDSNTQPKFCFTPIPFWFEEGTDQNGFLEITGMLEPIFTAFFKKQNIRITNEGEGFQATDDFADYGRIYGKNNATGLIGMIVANICDIALAPNFYSYADSEYVDYSAQYSQTVISIFSGKPIKEFSNSFKLLEIFNLQLWLLSLVTFISIPVILSLSDFLLQRKNTLSSNFIDIVGLFLLQDTRKRKIKRTITMIYWGLWITGVSLVTTFFSSSLLSIITLPDTLKYFDSVSDLFLVPNTNIKIPMETPTYYYFMDQNTPLKTKVWNQCVRLNSFFNFLEIDISKELQNLLDGKQTAILDYGTTFLMMDTMGKCEDKTKYIHASKSEVLVSATAFMISKNYKGPATKILKSSVIHLFESGSIQHNINLELMKKPTCLAIFDNPNTIPVISRIKLANFRFPFAVLLFGSVLSLLVTLNNFIIS